MIEYNCYSKFLNNMLCHKIKYYKNKWSYSVPLPLLTSDTASAAQQNEFYLYHSWNLNVKI